MKNLRLLGAVAAACFLASSCAFTRQSVRTMDGDEFSQFAGSTLGKQDSAQEMAADFYPNNSGASIQVGGKTEQDATAMVPVITALVSALAQQQAVTPPAERGRIEQLEAQIAALQRLVERLGALRGGE